MGVACAALSTNAFAQFAIEDNAKMGGKVTNVTETSKSFTLDFSSDTEVGQSVQIKGLYAKTYNEAGETVSVDLGRGKCESLNGNGNPLVLNDVESIVSVYRTDRPVVGFIGLDATDKAFGIVPGSANKNVELAMVFSLRGCNMESDVTFDLVTAHAGTSGSTNTYKLLVGLDSRPDWGEDEYGFFEGASSADNTEKLFVFDNIYTSGAKGDKKTIELAKLLNKKVTDLSYKTVYLFLYTSGSTAAIEEGKYDPVVCFDNLSLTYNQPIWLTPEVSVVDQNFNYNDSVPVEVEVNTTKELKFRVKDKNRGGTLVFRCNAEKFPGKSVRWNFPETGGIKAKDDNGEYTIDVPYSYTPSDASGSQVIMTVAAPAPGELAEDDLEVTLLFKAAKRVITRPAVDKVEIDNGIRYFMTVLAQIVKEGTGIDNRTDEEVMIWVEDGMLKGQNLIGSADIYSLSGMKVLTVSPDEIENGVALNKGIYVVMVDGIAHKVII